MSDVPATPPYPRVVPCRHCGRPVLRDNDGVWIHADLSYVCRDRWGGITATTAAPEPPAWYVQQHSSTVIP
ncbi:hypothetical protein [Micromonospora sp. NBC_01813]|uniref:hypothetical protein n=1 Tax=Micromonospora sp. NBC_01813 TaxID=2975988 RepID=UPI002DD7E8DE|nr:hypothetical protein [Micromonospora sp. NBC_01813]WSA06185.1 hypothetical protein OG958_17785 [Micromonospora sp. NBC_01813]